MRKHLSPSELILNADGSIYHLHLLPEYIADTVITVGDQNRAKRISDLFDDLEFEIVNREFSTYTGRYKGKRISVCSTGIGTDNIDIFLNELDAVVNIDLKKRKVKSELKSLNIIRVGTSGSIQKDIPVGSLVASTFAVGTDNLAYYYNYKFTKEERDIALSMESHFQLPSHFSKPYIIGSSPLLLSSIGVGMFHGITTTATGFYAPQGRSLRATVSDNWKQNLISFSHSDLRITNLEMETSGLYTLSKVLGHHCISCSAILANRVDNSFADNPIMVVDNLIEVVLERISKMN